MALSVESTVASVAKNLPTNFTFDTIDYVVFIFMLAISAGIGAYFGFFSKSKNTTDEYLMGSKQMKTLPIAISLVASQLSGIAIMSVPAETYTFGFNYIFLVLSMILVIPTLNYIIVPVFYDNSISNCYEYLQMRFNKRTRQLVTLSFVLNACLMLPVYIFVPALAFSQVTGINIHLINAVVCSICIFYTMLGGIKAVVWTDVVQAGIMLSSVVLVGVLGTLKVGGLQKVLEYAGEGGRLDFNYSLDPRVRSAFLSLFGGGFFMWTGHIGLNQSCVQRIVSLPSMQHARQALIIAGIGVIIIMGFNSFIGIVMFARYIGCDPILGGIVEKADKMMPFFVQDVVGHLKGMPGIFISCVFSAALSTMSAMLNSLSGVVYFDYIKPFIKHTDARANTIMKIFVVVMGCYCIVGGLMVQKFNSILQTIITITGINTGAVVGVFLLGMFVPRVNGKVAIVSIAFSIFTMLWIIVNAQMHFKSGLIKYDPLPTSLDKCDAINLQGMIQNIALIIAGIGVIIIMGFNSFIGIVMFARYIGCDPILGGIVEKADKMMPFFVQDVVGHLKGMPGIFISCVFSAALSTMSAMLNSLSGVVYFDYIKPFIKHTDARANTIMKIFVVVMGCYCIVGGLMVQKFNSILQTIITITGINTGAVVGVFLLGMFVPRVNGKVAIVSIAFSIFTMLWIIVNAQMHFKSGLIKYDPLPTSLDKCDAINLQGMIQNITTTPMSFTTTEKHLVTTAFHSNRDFSIYEISFYWYKPLGVFLVWILAIPLSYIWKRDKEDKMNPKLYSPFVKRFLNEPPVVEMENIPLRTPFPSLAGGDTKILISENPIGNGDKG